MPSPRRKGLSSRRKHRGGGRSRKLSNLRWQCREAIKEGRSVSPLLSQINSIINREPKPATKVITVEEAPPPSPINCEAPQEATTPQPPNNPPPCTLPEHQVLNRPPSPRT